MHGITSKDAPNAADMRSAARASGEAEKAEAADGMDFATAPPPSWAIGKAAGYMQPGAVLPTRDGRKLGNAIVGAVVDGDECPLARIYTDAGSMIELTAEEMESFFHPPEWISEVTCHPGWLMHRLKSGREAT